MVNFEHISHLVLVFLLLTLDRQMPAGSFLLLEDLVVHVETLDVVYYSSVFAFVAFVFLVGCFLTVLMFGVLQELMMVLVPKILGCADSRSSRSQLFFKIIDVTKNLANFFFIRRDSNTGIFL